MMQNTLMTLLESGALIEGKDWHRQQFKGQERIVERGDDKQYLYLILEGKVQVEGSASTSDGKELRPSFTTLGKGELFGELVLFDSQPRSASVTAIEKSELAVIDGPCLMTYLDSHREEGYEVMQQFVSTLVTRLRSTNEKLFSLYAWGLKAHGIDEHL